MRLLDDDTSRMMEKTKHAWPQAYIYSKKLHYIARISIESSDLPLALLPKDQGGQV